jgi:hypothetical protein
MTPQTKLKIAMEEMKDICKKYDIAAAIVLHTPPGNGEYALVLNPSYSCAYATEDNSVNFYSKSKDYASKEEQHLHQENTANMLKILTETSYVNFKSLKYLSDAVDKITDATHE